MQSKPFAVLFGTLVAAMAAILIVACSRQEAPPPPPPAANDKAEPAEGAPRIAIAPDGIHVQYRVYGTSGTAEPALVFIHGWSCDSNYWREQVPEFKKKYTVVTVDLAGHGGTDGSRSDWSMARFGQDVATALAAVPNRQLVLVGHSMGGPVAIEAARLLKGRVIGIIGVDTFKTIGAPLLSAAQLDAAVKPFEANFIGHTREVVARYFFAPGADQALANKVAYDMSLSPPNVAIPAMRAVLSYDFAAPLKEITAPIVAINSDLGEPVNDLRIRKVLPRFRAVVIPGDGHFLMLEDPARFNPALETEVQALLASPAAQ
jgi:pimeloyl-ACP methyl ester carboxylesterase